MIHFADLTYSDEELEQDAINYFKTAVYLPSYVDKVKEFIAADLNDFSLYYNDDDYIFCHAYYDEFQDGFINDGDNIGPRTDFKRLKAYIGKQVADFGIEDEDLEGYIYSLETEFRKNAFCTHMEPYFIGSDKVVATALTGYSRNPIFSIYSMVREWCMALHLKFMHPEIMRRFGYRYQFIKKKYSGEERLRRLIEFREKYRLVFQNVGSLRAIHSSVFAYTYLYLKAVQTREVMTMEKFIYDNSSSQITLLLQGETIQNIDFPITKYVVEQLKEGAYEDLMDENGAILWGAVYAFVMEAIKHVGGLDNLRSFGFEGIEANAIRAFWNKSDNMQKMLKILRRLAMGNNDPIINQLIEMCEYRLGRPNKARDKMEQFIEETRRIMERRAYELTRPRTMAQELIARFPSVFLVYFQWHHNFRNIYPRVPIEKVREEQQKQINTQNNQRQQRQKSEADDHLRNRIYADDREKVKFREVARKRELDDNSDRQVNRRQQEENRRQNIENENSLSLVIKNREQSHEELLRETNEKKMPQNNIINEKNQRQNSL